MHACIYRADTCAATSELTTSETKKSWREQERCSQERPPAALPSPYPAIRNFFNRVLGKGNKQHPSFNSLPFLPSFLYPQGTFRSSLLCGLPSRSSTAPPNPFNSIPFNSTEAQPTRKIRSIDPSICRTMYFVVRPAVPMCKKKHVHTQKKRRHAARQQNQTPARPVHPAVRPLSALQRRWPRHRYRYRCEFRQRQACRPRRRFPARLLIPKRSWRRYPRPPRSPSAARERHLSQPAYKGGSVKRRGEEVRKKKRGGGGGGGGRGLVCCYINSSHALLCCLTTI